MGHKVHPYGFRLGVSRTWTAKWYADKEYTTLLKEDIAIRQLVDAAAGQRQRQPGRDRARHQPRHRHDPHGQAGHRHRQGRRERRDPAPADRRADRSARSSSRSRRSASPSSTPTSSRMNIAQQLSRRIAFRKAMKQAVQRTMKAGAKGVKIAVVGPPRRLRDGPPRVGQGGPHPARDAPRRHQLRPGPRPHDLRPHRRQGLDLPRRHHRPSACPPATPTRRRQPRRAGGLSHADAAAGQAPQGHARPDVRHGQGRPHGRLRRVRPGHRGAGLDHQPPDRGRPARDDPLRSSAAARSGSGSSRTSR